MEDFLEREPLLDVWGRRGRGKVVVAVVIGGGKMRGWLVALLLLSLYCGGSNMSRGGKVIEMGVCSIASKPTSDVIS